MKEKSAMKKYAVAMLLGVLLLCSVVNASAKEDLVAYTEISPETFSLMKETDEEKLNERLAKVGYSIKYINDLKVSMCSNLRDESESMMMYKPSLVSYNGEDVVFYISTNGALMCWNLKRPVSDSEVISRSAHVTYNEEDGDVLMETNAKLALVFNKKTSIIQCWESNCLLQEVALQENAVFCGKSSNLGYIFRCGDNVYTYTANCFATSAVGEKLQIIASGVEQVIVCNYIYDEYNCDVPLFQMKDGTIKAYVNNDENLGTNMDSEKYLKVPCEEGGYYSILPIEELF